MCIYYAEIPEFVKKLLITLVKNIFYKDFS